MIRLIDEGIALLHDVRRYNNVTSHPLLEFEAVVKFFVFVSYHGFCCCHHCAAAPTVLQYLRGAGGDFGTFRSYQICLTLRRSQLVELATLAIVAH